MAKSFQDPNKKVHDFLEELEKSVQQLRSGTEKNLARIEELKNKLKKPPKEQFEEPASESTEKKPPI